MELDKFIEKYEEGDVKIDIGCGTNKRKGYLGCDLFNEPDVRMDMRETWPFADESVDTIFAHHVLEHFDQDEIYSVLAEAWRVLRVDACLIACVPHAHSDLQIGCPQHKLRWLPFTPTRFCSQTFDNDKGFKQGKELRPWIVPEVLGVIHPELKGFTGNSLEFAKRHFLNVYQQLAFVMRKVRA